MPALSNIPVVQPVVGTKQFNAGESAAEALAKANAAKPATPPDAKPASALPELQRFVDATNPAK
jgi:hypothetical protein